MIELDKLDAIHTHTARRIDKGKLVCAATLVAQDGKILWQQRQGWSDYESRKPLRPHDLFRLASMTKPVNAAAAMIQAERNKLDLNDKVSRYVPAFGRMQVAVYNGKGDIVSAVPAEKELRLIDLLTHCNGMGPVDPYGPSLGADLHPRPGQTLSDIIPRLDQLLLVFQPGAQSGYSQTAAFDTMAYIIELTSGMDYGLFLRENIFGPLGMEDTAYALTPAQWDRLVRTYRITDDGITPADMPAHMAPNPAVSYTPGGDGLAGTIEDYYRFAQMLANEGELDGRRILSPQSVRFMGTAQLPPGLPGLAHGINWGLGMRVITRADADTPLRPGSFGWSGAYGTHFWIDPQDRLLAVYCTSVMGNRGAGPEAYEFERDVMAAAGSKSAGTGALAMKELC